MTVHSAPSPASVHHDVAGRVPGSPAPTLRPRRLTVEDVMSRDVVTVAPTATFHQMIGLMRKHEVSALPVVGDNGALLGVVSEADLLPKENPPPPRRRWLPEGGQSTERRHKASGASAREVMSTPAISIGRRAVLAAAVRVLEQHGIKRLVVLDRDDQLVGIVSRRDLLAAFSRSDAEIRRDVTEGVIPRWLMIVPAGIRVEVHGGVVRLEGVVDRRSDADILTHLVSGLDGVVDVDSTVNYRWNDRDLALSRELHVS
jgi:CBS domain-containing protein